MATEPIRIRIAAREQESFRQEDPRTAFWAAIGLSNERVSSLEGQLCREIGPKLRGALLRNLSEPLRTLDNELFPGSLERWMYRFLDGPTSDRYAVGEALSRILEQRQQLLRDNVDLRRVQERIAATAGIVFSCRIVRYSSLNLDLAAGSFNDIAKAFENDFDSFRVFLEAFIPVAFAEVFSEESADRLTFSAAIPASAEQAFRAAIQIPSPPIVATPAPPLPTTQSTDARARAEWLWRLANGSLLVPLLLALVVMYQGLRMLNDIRGTQFEAIRPVLEHQLRLLEEDRHRLLRDSASATRPSSPLVGLPK